jgi:hypothetical protein
MFTMKDLERTTGYSRDQLRDRLGHLWPIVAKDQRRGPRNAVLVGDKTLACLRRMQELETGELGPQDAAARIMEELGESGKHRTEAGHTVAPGEAKLHPTPPNEGDAAEPWRLLIAAKDETIERLESEVSFLRQRVEHLEPLALPAPREAHRGLFGIFRRKPAR